MKNLEQKILEERNNLKTDRLDMSLGEIINMYEEETLIISPEYQRSFRWEKYQQSRFIESLLLGIPIPAIFVAENSEGKWELVDGLQRVSTILSFFGKLKNLEKNNLILEEGDLIGSVLNNVSIENLPLKLKYTLKRSIFRVEILRTDSTFEMRYELFNRLNTGGTRLEPQEIRNCIFIGEFNSFLHEMAKNKDFEEIISVNTQKIEKMFLEELVLRHIAVIYGDLKIKRNLQNYLSCFMKKVANKEIILNLKNEKEYFIKITDYLKRNFDSKIFSGGGGAFSENYYDTIFYILRKKFEDYEDNPELFREHVNQMKEDEKYQEVSGYRNAWARRLQDKFERALEIFTR